MCILPPLVCSCDLEENIEPVSRGKRLVVIGVVAQGCELKMRQMCRVG